MMRFILGPFLSFSLLIFSTVATAQYSILQGATSASTTQFTIVAPANEQLTIYAESRSSESQRIEPTRVERKTYLNSPWVVYRVRFDGLKLSDSYQLHAVDESMEKHDTRNFKMFDNTKSEGRLALLSCMLRQFHNPFLWNSLEGEHPDLIIISGDNAYLDRSFLLLKRPPKSGTEIWNSFAKSRMKLNLYKWKNLVPTITTWDDHDSGGNDVDSRYFFMSELRDIFQIFHGNDPIEGAVDEGPGVARQFHAFGRNFILLDGRSWREFNQKSPWLGPGQEKWLFSKLEKGENVIVSGTQVFGGYIQKDSLESNWPDYAPYFIQRLRTAAESKGAQLLFASGDVHFSEIQRIEPEQFGYVTYEITGSSAHSMAFPGHYKLKPHNPRRINATGTHNALIVDYFEGMKAFNVWSLGWRGNVLFTRTLRIGCEALLSD